MKKGQIIVSSVLASSLSVLTAFANYVNDSFSAASAEARAHRRSSHAAASSGRKSSARHSTHHAAASSAGKRHGHVSASKKSRAPVAAAKPKYAYPLDFFMMHAPDYDRSPLDDALSSKINDAFARGIADDINPQMMVRAGVFKHYPLSGGIFNRREDVKYIVLHSTETGIPVPGKNVINGWNSMGRRHPGAQYVVDRDGVIYQALDPALASVHVNIFKTLPGINNDNTIGIEMNHTGRQDYPAAQRQAVMRLVVYLQNRFRVSNENIITHRYAQQGDHTDPVNFDTESFLSVKDDFRNRTLALKRPAVTAAQKEEEAEEAEFPLASVYVQIHGPIDESKYKSALPSGSSLSSNSAALH